jgi:hypothetical protein
MYIGLLRFGAIIVVLIVLAIVLKVKTSKSNRH